MAARKKKSTTRRKTTSRGRKIETPVSVAIGPIPEWNHVAIPSIVPKKRLLLVPSQDTDVVSIVDLDGLCVLKSIKLKKGSAPWHVRATPDGRYALVSNSRFTGHVDHSFKGNSTLSVIDLRSGRLVGHIPVMGGPLIIEMDARRNRAYVTNRNSNTLSVIDLKSRKAVGAVKTGAEPFWVRMTPKEDMIVVSNFEDASLSLIDPDTLETYNTITVGTPLEKPFPEFGALGDTVGFTIARDGTAFVANWRSDTIATLNVYKAVRDGRRAVRTEKVVDSPFNMEIDDTAGLLVVGSYNPPQNKFVVFDVKGRTKDLSKRIADLPVDGTIIPTGRAAAVNYWMNQPFESRIVGFLSRGVNIPNPIDLVAIVI